MRRIDLTGQRFGLLKVEGIASADKGIVVWNCICDCGKRTKVRTGNLRTGAVKSCGCLKHQQAHNREHGESKSKLYRHWKSMIYRCYSTKSNAYKWYGARGIKVCDAWQTYKGFRDWVFRTRPDETYSVERIDVNGDYCPENCTWIPISDQANNRTSCVMITYGGITKNLTDWCHDLGLDYKLIHNRLFKLKWTFEKAITTPLDVSKRNKTRK